MAEKKDPIRSLIDTGRRAGKLTSSEISDAMEENGNVLDVEAMEKLYEELLMDSERDKMTRTASRSSTTRPLTSAAPCPAPRRARTTTRTA